jgi:hypothetical protein
MALARRNRPDQLKVFEELGFGPGFYLGSALMCIAGHDAANRHQDIENAILSLQRIRRNPCQIDLMAHHAPQGVQDMDGPMASARLRVTDRDLRSALAMLCTLSRYRLDWGQCERIMDNAIAALGRYLVRQKGIV